MNRGAVLLAFSIVCLGLLRGEGAKSEALTEEFPEQQKAITALIDEIFQTAREKDFDRLARFHLYGPKFTEFKNGKLRLDAEASQQAEQNAFRAMSDFRYKVKDMRVNVFDDAAVATFHGEFSAHVNDQPLELKSQCTLVFVRDEGSWKIVHEHFSPLTQ